MTLNTTDYPAESIGSIMTRNVPTCQKTDTLKHVLEILASKKWDSIRNVYILDGQEKVIGLIDMAVIIQSDHSKTAGELMLPLTIFLHPHEDQEKAVFLAVKHDIVGIPVVDKHGYLLGAITAHKIIDIMHDEHIEDALLTAGIHGKGSHIARLATERTALVVRSRAPWLMFGLAIGLGLGIISSLFEKSLQESIALAYFIPVVAYIADSVGTQTEAIAVRALATLKINYAAYMFKELFVGIILGALLGALGGLGAFLIAQSLEIGLVVALSLFVASTVAAVLAALIPILFKLRGKDPALGSGPISTALQDTVSVVIYFAFAMLLL